MFFCRKFERKKIKVTDIAVDSSTPNSKTYYPIGADMVLACGLIENTLAILISVTCWQTIGDPFYQG